MSRTARLSPDGTILTITMGTKLTHYLVEPIDSDKRVGSPAFKLTKGCLVKTKELGEAMEVFQSSGTISYHVIVDSFGPNCDCGDAVYRGHGMCKHSKALRAVGLIPSTDFPP